MPFFLDGNPTQGEISEAVNYLLSNFSQSVTADPSTGQIIGPGGEIQSYLYKYMYIKYATSFDGSVGFSNVPTGATYYGLRNTDDPTESTNPADYVWTKVSPGFGTTYFLYYLTTGGRSIQFQEATSVPNPGWEIDPGTAIDLDFVTNVTNTPANFVVIRIPNNSAAPTNAEVLSAIGRLPIDGDLCTINYNSGIASIEYKYTSGWAIFQKYITGDLIVADSIVGNNIAGGTITADKLFSTYIVVGGAAGDVNAGVTTISGGKITANSIAADRLSVSQLSAITANMGTLTAGEIIVGTSPSLSGTTMTGSGTHLYSDGRFAMGNSTTNIVFNGSSAYLNGFNVNANGSVTIANFLTSTIVALITFTISKQGVVQYSAGGNLTMSSSSSTFDSVLLDTSFLLKDSTGTVWDAGYCGAASRTANILGTYYFVESMAFSSSKTLSAGTYTLYVERGNLFTADSTGALSSPTLTQYSLTNAYSNYHAIFI